MTGEFGEIKWTLKHKVDPETEIKLFQWKNGMKVSQSPLTMCIYSFFLALLSFVSLDSILFRSIPIGYYSMTLLDTADL